MHYFACQIYSPTEACKAATPVAFLPSLSLRSNIHHTKIYFELTVQDLDFKILPVTHRGLRNPSPIFNISQYEKLFTVKTHESEQFGGGDVVTVP